MNSDVASNLLCKYALACKLTLQKSREASPRRQHLPKVPRLLLTSHSIAAKSLLGQHTKSTWCTPAWTTAHWWRDMPACMLFSGAVKQITLYIYTNCHFLDVGVYASLLIIWRIFLITIHNTTLQGVMSKRQKIKDDIHQLSHFISTARRCALKDLCDINCQTKMGLGSSPVFLTF